MTANATLFQHTDKYGDVLYFREPTPANKAEGAVAYVKTPPVAGVFLDRTAAIRLRDVLIGLIGEGDDYLPEVTDLPFEYAMDVVVYFANRIEEVREASV